ncbi:hypothetical protein P1J78_18305 [Psychromarinibacter sp. C21-152]|uniref:Uncharacterized protein n=1 Tax=Psychromarinibacter sediminicola TaxID=3033385 RepID=A0AAE3NV66_9RHOB|nr:hypothetical protein [Psychromarinibacter sediminicola]MDF0602696.1 hypothetical protein [Psychromarinibacter sediminicola]
MTALPPAEARLVFRDAARLRPRVTLSAGVAAADGSDGGWPRYAPAALVPQPPWRAPTDAEWAALTQPLSDPSTPGNAAARVAILRLPEEVVAPLLNAGHRAAEQPHQAFEISRQPDAADAIDRVTEFLRDNGADAESIRSLGFCAKPRGLATATVNTRRRRRAGLHLDRFDARPLSELAESRVRLCFNIGRGDRYFLYCPHSVPQMAEVLGQSDPDGIDEIGRTFLEGRPDYPVVRVAVAPGEAYLAATEYLIHDATTQEIAEDWDIHVAFLCRLQGVGLLQDSL